MVSCIFIIAFYLIGFFPLSRASYAMFMKLFSVFSDENVVYDSFSFVPVAYMSISRNDFYIINVVNCICCYI